MLFGATQCEFDDVSEFQEKMGHKYYGEPRMIPVDLQQNGIKHLREELEEYNDAINEGDLGKAFDALIDLTYVAKGLAYKHGFPWGEGWDAVQQSNMDKEPADSTSGGKGGVIKPSGWNAPDIDSIIRKHAFAHRLEKLALDLDLKSEVIDSNHIAFEIPELGKVLIDRSEGAEECFKKLTFATRHLSVNKSTDETDGYL